MEKGKGNSRNLLGLIISARVRFLFLFLFLSACVYQPSIYIASTLKAQFIPTLTIDTVARIFEAVSKLI